MISAARWQPVCSASVGSRLQNNSLFATKTSRTDQSKPNRKEVMGQRGTAAEHNCSSPTVLTVGGQRESRGCSIVPLIKNYGQLVIRA
jgi:hypothetical protein